MQKYKASILAVTLIILSIILVMALSVSVVALKQRSASLGSGKSNMAFQNADKGIEDIMNKLTKNPSSTLVGSLGACSVPSGQIHAVVTVSDYSVEFKKSNSDDPTDCATPISLISSIKSIGIGANQESRAIEAAVAMIPSATNAINRTAGPLPVSGNFTSSGGALVVFAAGSAYSTAVTTMCVTVKIDNVPKGFLFFTTNEVNSHKTLVPASLVVSDVSAGNHTVSIVNDAGCVTTRTDANDYYNATVLELH